MGKETNHCLCDKFHLAGQKYQRDCGRFAEPHIGYEPDKRHKSRKTAILGAIAGAAAMAVFSVPSNYFITYPAYVQFYHMPLEAILGMYQAILPSADSLIKCLVIFNMPFTLVKGLLDAVLCLLIYKPLSPILHGRK